MTNVAHGVDELHQAKIACIDLRPDKVRTNAKYALPDAQRLKIAYGSTPRQPS